MVRETVAQMQAFSNEDVNPNGAKSRLNFESFTSGWSMVASALTRRRAKVLSPDDAFSTSDIPAKPATITLVSGLTPPRDLPHALQMTPTPDPGTSRRPVVRGRHSRAPQWWRLASSTAHCLAIAGFRQAIGVERRKFFRDGGVRGKAHRLLQGQRKANASVIAVQRVRCGQQEIFRDANIRPGDGRCKSAEQAAESVKCLHPLLMIAPRLHFLAKRLGGDDQMQASVAGIFGKDRNAKMVEHPPGGEDGIERLLQVQIQFEAQIPACAGLGLAGAVHVWSHVPKRIELAGARIAGQKAGAPLGW